MALRKLIKETYQIINEERKKRPSYFKELERKFRPYVSRICGEGKGDFLGYWGIPSIPGGRLRISQTQQTTPYFNSIVKIEFRYLENSPKEDLEEVRQMIKESGLEKI